MIAFAGKEMALVVDFVSNKDLFRFNQAFLVKMKLEILIYENLKLK